MSTLFTDPMQMYADVDTQANALRRWSAVSGSNVAFIDGGGPFGGGCWDLTAENIVLRKYGAWGKSTFYLAGWVRQTGYENSRDFIRFMEGNNSIAHVEIEMENAAGSFDVKNGNGTSLGLVSGVLLVSTWHFFEIKLVVSDTVGEVTMQVDGVQKFSLTSKDTKNGGTGIIDSIDIYGSDFGGVRWSHIFAHDDAGFRGPCRFGRLGGQTETAQADFTPSAGTDNAALIDEQLADDDSTYVESSTVAHQDLYAMGAVETNVGDIHCVVASALARKDDAGARGLYVGVDSNGTEGKSADIPLTIGYAYHDHILDADPDTASAWTESGVNALEGLIEVAS